MENNYNTKHSLAIGVIVVLAFFGVLYYLNRPAQPYKVLTPDNYPEGTQISLYKNTPPTFPKGVIMEQTLPNYSGVVTTKEGKTQMTVSFNSDKKVEDILAGYKDTLAKEGWRVSVQDLRHSNYVLTMLKGGDAVVLTISLNRELRPLLTFQYEK
jgi:hypothetical protein